MSATGRFAVTPVTRTSASSPVGPDPPAATPRPQYARPPARYVPPVNERLGRRSLVLDAAYCAVVGVALVALRRAVARRIGAPPPVVGTAGAATVVWAG